MDAELVTPASRGSQDEISDRRGRRRVHCVAHRGYRQRHGDVNDPRVDTLFTYGYDAQTQLFFYNTYATDSSPLDCTLAGTLSATYGAAGEDNTIPVDQLTDDSGTVIFDPTGYDLTEGIEATTESAEYDGAAGECGISGVAAGSQGHINQGQFMKLFNNLIDMRGRGCLNRSLAQSDLGKDDQQVRTQDFTDTVIGSEGTIDFTTVEADCYHGDQDVANDHPGRGHDQDEADAETTDDGHGRPASPGKSDKAPGHHPDK